jgi:hypothetical protein
MSGESRYIACPIHGTIHRIDMACVQCYLAGPQQARDTLSVLEARIADHDSELSALRRQVIELRHIVLDLQRAHNKRVRS